jgi:uncharacterized membrane protein YbhN (UPF0104 family)
MSYGERRREYWSSPEFTRRNVKLLLVGLIFAIATSAVVTYSYVSGRLEVPAEETVNTLIARSVLVLFGYSAALVLGLIVFNALVVPLLRRAKRGDG